MSTKKHVVLARPRRLNDEITAHTHAWAEGLRQSFEENGWTIADCSIEKAKRVPVEEALAAAGPDSLFVFYGHGGVNTLIGQDKAQVCDLESAELLGGRKVYVVACSSAQESGLGDVAVKEHDVSVYFGYANEIKGYWDNRNEYGGMMYALGECVNSGMRAWLAQPGLTAGKIQRKMKKVYENWIDYYLEDTNLDPRLASRFAAMLRHNMDALELLGDKKTCLTSHV